MCSDLCLCRVPAGGNITMEIISKDQRVFRFKFSVPQQLENSYYSIMYHSQVNKHSNLYAYKYLEEIQKLLKEKGKSLNDLSTISFKEVREVV